MQNTMRGLPYALLIFCSISTAAAAQTTEAQALADQPSRTFDVKTMTFDLWCQQTQQYPAERCEKQLSADMVAFQNYRDAVERYEIQYLKQVEQNRQAQMRADKDVTQTERLRQDAPVR